MISSLKPKAVFKYSVMPQVMPRIQSLMFGGFGYVPYFLALVYQMVGLLPAHHPYLSQSNLGRFGIRHVIAEAARNITFSFKNIDQVILFVAVMAGVVIFFMQFIAIGAMIFFQPAAAIPTTWGGFFTIADDSFRRQDLASIMLDMVFGVPHPNGVAGFGGFFESCIGLDTVCTNNFGSNITDTAILGGGTLPADQLGPLSTSAYLIFPFPFHVGLHRLFSIYSAGLLIVAIMITMYFVVVILAETAQTGTPFGKRFNKTWAPLRIVIAFGLLVPLTVGLNSSQYLVLYAAKYGSAFASNGWRYFNDTLTSSYLGAGERMISVPNVPELDTITEFMYVATTCRYIHEHYMWQDLAGAFGPLTPSQSINAYIIGPESAAPNNTMLVNGTTDYDDVIRFLGSSTTSITMRFGTQGTVKPVVNTTTGATDLELLPTPNEPGGILPVCGELNFTIADARNRPGGGGSSVATIGTATSEEAEPGPFSIQLGYFVLVRDLWDTGGSPWINNIAGGAGFPAQTTTDNHRHKNIAHRHIRSLDTLAASTNHNVALDPVFVKNLNNEAQAHMKFRVAQGVAAQLSSARWGTFPQATNSPLYQKGWAGAGIWYNRISEMNGQVTAMAHSFPKVSLYPMVMEEVAAVKGENDASVDSSERFRPEASNIHSVASSLEEIRSPEMAIALYEAHKEWNTGSGAGSSVPASNPVNAAIKSIFGTTGLYDMRESTQNGTVKTHPLAQLSGIGRSLVESSIHAIGYSHLAAVFGLVTKKAPQELAKISASFFVTIAMIGLTVGVVLFYIVPFLPFIYFFFAVGGWIKGIFEAMVGAPLWALAHIRIDGEGMMGKPALNGYFLIFEVFLRPILILFGLLASVTIYSALVSVLNDIFDLVVDNVGGLDQDAAISSSTVISLDKLRGPIDQFFFTVIYAIIVYMMGMSSFKLIDTVPNNILRWMGQSVATFNDQREDPAQALVSRAQTGSTQVFGKLGGGLSSLNKSVASANS